MADKDIGAEFVVSFLIALVIALLIIGPLCTGVGLIFFSFWQAIGLGLVGFVVGLLLLTYLIFRKTK
jgi:hypothetical protein